MEEKNCISCFHWSPTLGECDIDDERVPDPEHYKCPCYFSYDNLEVNR